MALRNRLERYVTLSWDPLYDRVALLGASAGVAAGIGTVFAKKTDEAGYYKKLADAYSDLDYEKTWLEANPNSPIAGAHANAGNTAQNTIISLENKPPAHLRNNEIAFDITSAALVGTALSVCALAASRKLVKKVDDWKDRREFRKKLDSYGKEDRKTGRPNN